MKNIFKTFFLFAVIGLSFLISCDSDFEEINTDPDEPTEISVDLQLGFIERSLINQLYNIYAAGECASTWPQHISKPIYNDADRYYPRLGAINSFWNTIYLEVIGESDEMYRLAQEKENNAVQGVALTLKAIALQTLTDAFGDIPASEANLAMEGNYTPKYDTQQEVYVQIFELLDQAIAKFNTGVGAINSEQDLIYAGDTSKWLKFATSVKFRALMRVSNTSLFSLQELMTLASSNNLIIHNADNAFIQFSGQTTPNINPHNDTKINGREAEWCMGEALVNFMLSENDPRLPVYANPNDSNEYRGKPAGYINPGVSGYGAGTVSQIGDAFMAADAPLYFITAAQVNLLLAEASEIHGIGVNPEVYFYEGVSASLEQNGLDPLSYTPAYNGYQSIAEQMWVGTFLQGYETWAEWRRSDIPANLELAVDPQPGVNAIPTRYTYTTDEVALNGSNVDEAVANQGADALTTKVWWDNN
ncbi:MAG: SusD/RagB family nutrient-binding outer membrane lipoprotein [Muricauda sp.]|nr:SusD/RagB family nutrient-binding outer membrane lipoprotein [Allomuricauda sp.]